MQKPIIHSILCLSLALVGAGCSKSTGPESAPQTAPKADQTVVWPALKALDSLGHKAAAVLEKKDFAGMRALLPECAKVMGELVSSAVPANVKNPLTVKELLADAKEVAGRFSATDLKDDDLTALFGGLEGLAENLLHESGMPHTHDH
jgi:hypothetical protein